MAGAATRTATHDPTMARNAERLGALAREEGGAASAVAILGSVHAGAAR
ncbi:hypothetical protein [Pseudonocardia kunmingensis]|nr:hypothetical protein [Pseudonocardia kunmingensis]